MALLNPSSVPRPRRARPCAALALWLGLAAPGAHAQVDESRLKAAFVYNIVAFASWSGGGRDLQLCTATGGALDGEIARLAGRQVGQRRIAVRRGAAPGCDVLVRAGAVPDAPVPDSALVICDGCALPDGGSAVSLLREDNRIRFEIDAGVAAGAGVGFSSQLLRLARRVL